MPDFQLDWIEIVNFLSLAHFWACAVNLMLINVQYSNKPESNSLTDILNPYGTSMAKKGGIDCFFKV